MIDMAKEEYLPAIEKYQGVLANAIKVKTEVSKNVSCKYEMSVLETLDKCNEEIFDLCERLSGEIKKAKSLDGYERARHVCDFVNVTMSTLRKVVDSAEKICPKDVWTLPGYNSLLFSV